VAEGSNTDPSAKAIDQRLADEVAMLNAAWERAEQKATAERAEKALPAKSAEPVKVATFEC